MLKANEHQIISNKIGNDQTRLCKRSLFERYINLQISSKTMYSYEDCKRECEEYRAAKKRFIEILECKHMGRWIERDSSFDAFIVNKKKKLT